MITERKSQMFQKARSLISIVTITQRKLSLKRATFKRGLNLKGILNWKSKKINNNRSLGIYSSYTAKRLTFEIMSIFS